MKNHIALYTAVFDQYDLLFEPKLEVKNTDYIIFTNSNTETSCVWEYKRLPPDIYDGHGKHKNRFCKINSQILLNEYDYSIYIDGNIRIIGDFTPMIDQFIESGAAIGMFRHPHRENIFDELGACRASKKLTPADEVVLPLQIAHYRSQGLPSDHGLFGAAIIFRWHRHPKLNEAMELWWSNYCRYVKRDQVSWPYVLWKTNIPFYIWDFDDAHNKSCFARYDHRSTPINNIRNALYVKRNDSIVHNFVYLIARYIRKIFA